LVLKIDARHETCFSDDNGGLKGKRGMLAIKNIRIENARLYPRKIVDQLLLALSNGTQLHADESRIHFYDLEADGRKYFIYVSPVNASVTLIATWAKKRKSSLSKSAAHDPWWRWITAHVKMRSYT
jgi:hypothetical protein